MNASKKLGALTILSFISTVLQSQPRMIYYYLTTYPWLWVNIRDIYIMCVNKTWLTITAVLLAFWIAERMWGKVSGGYGGATAPILG